VDEGAVVATLRELIDQPSVGGTEDEVGIQHWLAEQLGDLGLTVDLWPLDLQRLRSTADYPGEEVNRSEGWGLVATNQPGRPVDLILQGHVDVVPAGDPTAWSDRPFHSIVTADTVTGRGACDMKAGVAAILGAVSAVSDRLGDLPSFSVHFVIGEEDGGLGAFATLERGHTGAACVIPEPTGLQLLTANAGALTFRIEVPGLATHGSTAYAGSSAVSSYVAIHQALAALETRRNRNPEPLMQKYPVAYPLSVGRIQAGDWSSSVPDLLVAEGRYGLRIEEDPAHARTELEQAVLEAANRDPYLSDHPPRISWPGGQFGGGHLPAGHPLRDRVRAAHAAATTGDQLGPEQGAPYGSDLRLYAGAGIPTLHYGPGDVRLAHGPDESVPIAQLLTATRTFTELLLPSPSQRAAKPGLITSSIRASRASKR